MLQIVTTDPCTDEEYVCNTVLDWTGNDQAAWAADLLVGTPLAIAGLLILFFVLRWVLGRLVDRLVARAESGALTARVGRLSLGAGKAKMPSPTELATATRRVQRAKAMGSLLKSVITGVLLAVIGTMVLAEIGVNVGPIIASAGIVGIALGFGAQSLVSDYLAGIFMVFEDQYGVGDEVDLGEASGTVEAVSLRVTRVRDVNGTVWYVRNGEIVRVGNMSQNWARSVIDVSVAYHEDLARVRRVLEDVAHDMWEDDDYRGVIIEEPSVWGVQELGVDGVVVRVALKTAPLEQWAVAREMRQRIKARFDHEGIEIPYPQRMVWHRGAPGEEQPADAASTAGEPTS
ncbi:mechanosensitive ion channel family protein [Nocardioides euryhalodurans]|uniref:Mechanosensitive ion channel family protein n=1 Tax=Nocardioides euryhalodurans TaxID=2518370 RepID=A0A4P7GP71_9ACTN|nr:mechanosensitive ion channel family protein [Nocardioides euryhalodurans]QBR93910.1 mechanosensitive ion channel family protein [Nocardioides euryhalodurans]